MRQITFKFSNRALYTLILISVLIISSWIVFAYGGSEPVVMGHSAAELEETDPTVLASVKNGVSWNEVTNKPAGFADGVDNEGITTESDPTVLASVKNGVSWNEVTNKPAGVPISCDWLGWRKTFTGLTCSWGCGSSTTVIEINCVGNFVVNTKISSGVCTSCSSGGP